MKHIAKVPYFLYLLFGAGNNRYIHTKQQSAQGNNNAPKNKFFIHVAKQFRAIYTTNEAVLFQFNIISIKILFISYFDIIVLIISWIIQNFFKIKYCSLRIVAIKLKFVSIVYIYSSIAAV